VSPKSKVDLPILVMMGCGLISVVSSRSDGQAPARYGVGRPATPAEIAAWDIDANPTGAGLPAGRGTAAEGESIFAAKCASCHGSAGQGLSTAPKGLPPAPPVVGREPREGFPFWQSPKYPKTVGNYWPYATTLYDYINRAMPLNAPGSLDANEIYALVAWILGKNEIIPRTSVIDATTLPRVTMPARDRFVPDDRRPGPEFR
jgi:S-disulfanyl-L-cysteine oxidoreductase SoxD